MDGVDAYSRWFLPHDDGVDPDVTGEPLSRSLVGRSLRLSLHGALLWLRWLTYVHPLIVSKWAAPGRLHLSGHPSLVDAPASTVRTQEAALASAIRGGERAGQLHVSPASPKEARGTLGRARVEHDDHPGRRIRLALVGAIVLSFLIIPAAGATATSPPAAPVAWVPCPTVAGYLCGTITVPLDYRHPSRGSVHLAVMEHPVPHSKGVIVFNPGGPGESGLLILPILASLVPVPVRDQFTLVSFDERGTGSSEPLLCGPSPAAASSAVAGTAAAARTFGGLERSCQFADPTLFPTVTTTTSARDMDRLRIALGVRRIGFYGLSYGTALGSVYAQLFPGHVRSMVLRRCRRMPTSPSPPMPKRMRPPFRRRWSTSWPAASPSRDVRWAPIRSPSTGISRND